MPTLDDYTDEGGGQLLTSIAEVQAHMQEMQKALEYSIAAVRADLMEEIDRLQRQATGSVDHQSKGVDPKFVKLELDLIELRNEVQTNAAATVGEEGSLHHEHSYASREDRMKKALSLVEDTAEYEFEESVWDLAMFIGLPELGCLGSLLTTVLCAANIAMQTFFCIICILTFTKMSELFGDDALSGLQDFRSSTGHNHIYFDEVQRVSLAERICVDRGIDWKLTSLVNSNHQLFLLDTVDAYLPSSLSEGWMHSIFAGEMLVIMALSCWFLTVFAEMRDTIQCFRAVINMKRGGTIMNCHQEEFHLASISCCRLCFMLFLISQKLAVGCSLLFAGGKWLAETPSVENLMLNVVALQVIFEVDELLFIALATDPNKKFIEKLQPVMLKRLPLVAGVDSLTLSLVLITPSTVALFYKMYVVPMVEDMRQATAYLCENDLRWTYSIDNVFGLPWIQSNTQNTTSKRKTSWGVVWDEGPFAGAPDRLSSLVQNSVRNLVRNVAPEVRISVPVLAVNDVSELSALSFESMVTTLNPTCVDIFEARWADDSFRRWVQVVTDNSTVSSCEDVKSLALCEGLNQPYRTIRLLCSLTCGCADPMGPLFSHDTRHGCAPLCTQSALYKTTLNNLNFTKTEVYDEDGYFEHYACLDLPNSWLITQDFWRILWSGLLVGANSPFVRSTALNMSTQGCEILDNIRNMPISLCDGIAGISEASDCRETIVESICRGTSPHSMRPLSPFCPWSCRCDLLDPQDVCPLRCSTNSQWDYEWGYYEDEVLGNSSS